MIFRIYLYFYIFTIFFIFNRIPIEIILLIWYFRRILFFIKINSHISFMLLSLELISVISLTLISLLLLKKLIEVRFFFLFICLLVGEACLGLRLIVISSRFQKKELISLSII